MAWKDVTITEAGEQLLASLKNGDELMITRAGIGSGTVPVESMALLLRSPPLSHYREKRFPRTEKARSSRYKSEMRA